MLTVMRMLQGMRLELATHARIKVFDTLDEWKVETICSRNYQRCSVSPVSFFGFSLQKVVEGAKTNRDPYDKGNMY